jgi:hypothetical protein
MDVFLSVHNVRPTTTMIWSKLPNDIVAIILRYDGRITYRHGVYIDKIPNPDVYYPKILERMRFHRFRRYCSNLSFVTIHVIEYEKIISYVSSNSGITITMFSLDTYDSPDFHVENVLFTNVTKKSVNLIS